MWESRVAPLSGVLFGVLLVGAFLISPNTDFMPPADEVVAFYGAGPRRAMTAAYLILLSAAALTWFTASIHRWLSRLDDDGGRLSMLAASGGVLAAAMLAVSGVATVAAAERLAVVGTIDPGSAATLFDISGIATGNAASIGFGLLIGSTGLVVLRSAAGPRWVGWVSLAIALGLFSPFAWVLIAIALVWVPATGVWIYRVERQPDLVPSA